MPAWSAISILSLPIHCLDADVYEESSSNANWNTSQTIARHARLILSGHRMKINTIGNNPEWRVTLNGYIKITLPTTGLPLNKPNSWGDVTVRCGISTYQPWITELHIVANGVIAARQFQDYDFVIKGDREHWMQLSLIAPDSEASPGPLGACIKFMPLKARWDLCGNHCNRQPTSLWVNNDVWSVVVV